MNPHYWNDASRHLSRACPVMKTLIRRYKGEGLRARGEAFYTLLRSVVGQQISVKAADAVWAKVFATVQPLTPQALLALDDAALRACGLSASKVAYARNVAAFFIAEGIPVTTTPHTHAHGEGAYWKTLSDEEVIAKLTSIKGIGSWTAEMFLIFHLLRPNVFPIKDLGVLKAINLHCLEADHLGDSKWLKPQEYMEIAQRWQPYRTVATWYLWRALDPVPVAY